MFNYNEFKYSLIKNEKNNEKVNEVIDLISEEPNIDKASDHLNNQNNIQDNNINQCKYIKDIHTYFKYFENIEDLNSNNEDKEIQQSLKQIIHFNPIFNQQGICIFKKA